MNWTPVESLKREGIELHLVFASSNDENGDKVANYESSCGNYWAKHVITGGCIHLSSNVPF